MGNHRPRADSWSLHRLDQVALSFNGGKDCKRGRGRRKVWCSAESDHSYIGVHRHSPRTSIGGISTSSVVPNVAPYSFIRWQP
jgi:hypothetical protein